MLIARIAGIARVPQGFHLAVVASSGEVHDNLVSAESGDTVRFGFLPEGASSPDTTDGDSSEELSASGSGDDSSTRLPASSEPAGSEAEPRSINDVASVEPEHSAVPVDAVNVLPASPAEAAGPWHEHGGSDCDVESDPFGRLCARAG